MPFNSRKIDIHSRGKISEHLIQVLLKNGQVKDCEYLKIEKGYLRAFYVKCTKDFAASIPANNVVTDMSASSAPSSYSWPNCPKDCRYFLKSKDFIRSLNSDLEEIVNHKAIMDNFDSTLNPLPIIISTLSNIKNSDIVLGIIHQSGISIDLSLTKEQEFSHKTRIREYLRRINNTLQKSSKSNLLHSLHLLVNNILIKFPESQNIIEKSLLEIGWKINNTSLSPRSKNVIELFFLPGLVHSAYQSIRAVIEKAQSDIDIIDLYIDKSLFEILKVKSGAKKYFVRILTKIKKDDFDYEKSLFISQYTNISIERKNVTDFHDRFIIIDGKLVYHLGASIKDAGKKAFMVSKIKDNEIKNSIIKSFEDRWV